MVPKTIHFFWFGKAKKTPLTTKCIASWQEFLPDYNIIEWNESNYDVTAHPYTKKAYEDKKWAFLSDFARLDVLTKEGGLYLDTDMEVVKSFDQLPQDELFVGMESDVHINGSIIGATPNHWFLKETLEEYRVPGTYESIPTIMTRVIERYAQLQNSEQTVRGVHIYPTEYFYPFPFGGTFHPSCITPNTYSIHWWNHSWGSKKATVLKKLGLLNIALKMKRLLKK